MAAAEEEVKICAPGGHGMFFPLTEVEQTWAHSLRAVLYLAALLYLFLGVNIVSDKFVAAIEVITSQKKRVRHKTTGRIVTVAVWNGTVANLTLMALGSSAPEILLSVVETVAGGFHSGDLGPGTIVGSAAFNLFMIVGVCIMAIPSPETRKIKEMGVYTTTVAFSLFAYAWLVIICSIITPNVIDIWEGVVTLLLLPVLVFVSYLADIGYFSGGKAPQATQTTRALMIEDDPFVQDYGRRPPARTLSDLPAEASINAQSSGVLAFPVETWDVAGGFEEREVSIPVLRRHGFEGVVACKYRMEGRSAVPDYDFVATAGELVFGPGEDRSFLVVKLLPKRLGEHSDQFQIIIEDAQGGAIFDPRTDGGEERCVLTVTIHNENDDLTRFSAAVRASQWVDGVVNIDSLQLFARTWREEIVSAVTQVVEDDDDDEDDASNASKGQPSASDWAMHIVSVPWKFAIAVCVPPPTILAGWLCFAMSLACIGFLTCVVIDFAELFGCVAHIEDSITAITLVALGTSMPDLFASKCAAAKDEYADASIVNVTGSNSVNVFLGIGLPWSMSSIYWAVMGATPEWKAMYPSFVDTHPEGAFIVKSGDLAFSVTVFTLAAVAALTLIHIRRVKFGGELGGPYLVKAMSAVVMVCLWCFYLALSIWKIINEAATLGDQAFAIFIGVCVMENLLLCCAVGLYFFKGGRKEADGSAAKDLEEGSEVGGAVVGATAGKSEVITRGSAPPHHRPPYATFDAYYGTARNSAPPGFRQALQKRGMPSPFVDTFYGMRMQDRMPDPASALSFTSAAMVCVAVQRFRSSLLHRRFRSISDPLQAAGQAHFGEHGPPLITREASFHSISDIGASPTTTPRTPRLVGQSVAGRVADIVGRSAVDWAALGAAGLAAAQFVDADGAAAFLGGGPA